MTQNFNPLQKDLTVQVTTILFITLLVGFIVLIIQPPSSSPSNTRMFLSTLATGQASVLAIVFSVTVVGVQLIATQYSPQLVSVFANKELWITVGIFSISISLDLFLLYTIDSQFSRTHTAGIYMSVVLAIGAIYILVVFVRNSLARSTPEGATDAFAERITPELYLNEVKQATESDTAFSHPMRPLFQLIMRTVAKDERVSAKYALKTYSDISQTTMGSFLESTVYEDEERGVQKRLFETVTTEHLPEIAEIAEQHGERDIVNLAVETLADLSIQSLSIGTYSRTVEFSRGFEKMFRRAAIEEAKNHISIATWNELRSFLEKSAKEDRPKVVHKILKTTELEFSRQVQNAEDLRWMHHSSIRLLESLHTTLVTLLEEYSEEYQEDIDSEILEVGEGTRALEKWLEVLVHITDTTIQSEEERDVTPVSKGNLKDQWKQACISASKSQAEDYAIRLCQAVIEYGIIISHEDSDEGFFWIDTLARVKENGDKEIVMKALNELLNYEHREEGPERTSASEIEQVQSEYYTHLTQLKSPQAPTIDESSKFDRYYPINVHPDYPEIVQDFQRKVEERVHDLQQH